MFFKQLMRLLLLQVFLLFTLSAAMLAAEGKSRDEEKIIHNNITYGTVISPYTGKIWLDRNLGASRVCTSYSDTACYGDYYQWGRNQDGHQNNTSTPTRTQATNLKNAGSKFVIKSSNDWSLADTQGAKRSAGWSHTDGSSVCPVGYRVPTLRELKAETLDNGVSNRDTAFSSFLKLPSAGSRASCSGAMYAQGSRGYVWTSSVFGDHSYSIEFSSDNAKVFYGYDRANGFSLRCVKD